MSLQVDEIKQVLSREDQEFQQWSREHHQYEDRLAVLANKPTLTLDEELEEKQLKKRKLFLKDQMAERIRGYGLSHTA